MDNPPLGFSCYQIIEYLWRWYKVQSRRLLQSVHCSLHYLTFYTQHFTAFKCHWCVLVKSILILYNITEGWTDRVKLPWTQQQKLYQKETPGRLLKSFIFKIWVKYNFRGAFFQIVIPAAATGTVIFLIICCCYCSKKDEDLDSQKYPRLTHPNTL